MDSSAAAAEIAAEQQHVDRVYARLEIIQKQAREAEAAGYSIARVGNFGALVERDAMVYHASRRRRALEAEHEGLVFGRLDLRGGEVRYIGRIGIRDAHGQTMLIDWRAPAAAAFYQATAAAPLDVVRRRVISSRGQRVTGLEDDLLDPSAATEDLQIIGDGALVAALARTTGVGMRDIVATIAREQDEAIRSPALGVTLVRGGPGTGKTAVALHRAAYLLYADRRRFAGGGVLVVGPSPVFVNYISRVLPALGEDAATLRSLGGMVPGTRAERHDSPEVARIKGCLPMARLLGRTVRGGPPQAPAELRLLYRGTLLRLSTRTLRQLRATVLGGGARYNAVRAKAAGYALDALWRQAVELLGTRTTQAREEFATDVSERREFVAFMRSWWPRLTPMEVLGWLGDPNLAQRYARADFSTGELAALARSLRALAVSNPGPDTMPDRPGVNPGPDTMPDRPEGTEPSIEDVALIDELTELLGSPATTARRNADPFMVSGVREVTTYADRMAAARAVAIERPADYREYAHVVVDESQDVSPMQWRMIGRRGQYASWTVVGDPAQAAWTQDAAQTTQARDAALGHTRRHEYVLHTNYRNAQELFDLAAAVVRRSEPNAEVPVAVRRGAVAPRLVHTAERSLLPVVEAEVNALLSAVEGTVGVITTAAARDRVAGALAASLTAAGGRLQVVTSLDAKGMEYDGVLVVEPASIEADSPGGARTLYVALSRATARLTTVDTQDSWLPEGYAAQVVLAGDVTG